LRLVLRAPGPRTRPDRLTAVRVARAQAQRRPSHRGHVRRSGRVLDAVAPIPGGSSDHDARVIEIGVERVLADELVAAPRVRDDVGAGGDGLVLGREQVAEGVRARLYEQDVAVLTDLVRDLDVEGDLEGPARITRRVAGAAVLVDLAEAAVGARTLRQA